MAVSVAFCSCFGISVVFSDPMVIVYNADINFTALSLFFGTINALPLIFLLFIQDKSYRKTLNSLIEKMSLAIRVSNGSKSKGGWVEESPNGNNDSLSDVASNKNKKPQSLNRLLHLLLGNTYTINPNVPIFKYSTVLPDGVHMLDSSDKNDEENENNSSETERNLYKTSLVVLFE
jgi:hypothetical protein